MHMHTHTHIVFSANFAFQMDSTARSQETAAESGSPIWVQRRKHSGHFHLLPQLGPEQNQCHKGCQGCEQHF